MRRILLALFFLFLPSSLLAQANGNLQIHFIDVGQGDAALLISPVGETVLFDDGNSRECGKPVGYLDQLGVTKIDYLVVSHYHADHIGCTEDVLDLFPLVHEAFDRGGSYDSATYRKHVAAVGAMRVTAQKGQTLTLDAGTTSPVTITFVAVDGNGIETENENDRSLVAKVHMGTFDAVIGGDLSGFDEGDYFDIETSVAGDIGQVEVDKVNHHGSRYSSNNSWLDTLHPRVGVISVGTNNRYHHPTEECLNRLHQAGVVTYWTASGNGVEPAPDDDVIAGTVIVEYPPGGGEFTVAGTRAGTPTKTFANWEGAPGPVAPGAATYVWSKASRGRVYHKPSCPWAAQISPKNLKSGTTPPNGWTLHNGCPN